MLAPCSLGAAQAIKGPEDKDEDEGEPDSVGCEGARRLASEEASGGIEDGGEGV